MERMEPIKAKITDHPYLKETVGGTPIVRVVQWAGFVTADMSNNDTKKVSLAFLIWLESPEGTPIPEHTPIYKEYRLSNDIYFNALGEIVAKEDPSMITSELEYWCMKIADGTTGLRGAIVEAIHNLDLVINFFN